MIISSSGVGMSSNRSYSSTTTNKTVSLITNENIADSINLSTDSKNVASQLETIKKDIELDQSIRAQAVQSTSINNNRSKSGDTLQQTIDELVLEEKSKIQSAYEETKSKIELKLKLLRRLIELLQKANAKGVAKFDVSSLTKEYFNLTDFSQSTAVTNSSPQTWKKITATSSFFAEEETTAFTSSGIAKTADGRELSFNITVEMSRSFCEEYQSFTKEDYVFTDPLVINLDSNVASISDQKFLFDLNSDGSKEEISFTNKGSGFLALDKNEDGMINDGSELFGTQSGNGFADLMQYDEDGNNWIDEADSIYNKLKVWTLDEAGNSQLLDLKQANVGAIYLGNTDTQFSLNNASTNQTNGIIRRTGIYLKETGEVGTVQHIDLAL